MKPMFKVKTNLFLWLFLIAPLSIFCQTWVDIYTNPMRWADNKANLGVQVLPHRIIGLTFEGVYSSTQTLLPEMKTNVGGYTLDLGTRYYPFGIQAFLFSKRLQQKASRNGTVLLGCYNFNQIALKKDGLTSLQQLLKGLYLGVGYQLQQYEANYVEQFAQNAYHFKVHNQGATVTFGYLMRIENITLGANYMAALTKPTLIGNYNDAIKDKVFNNNSTNVDTQWKLQIGLNF
ncbi:MAG: hypothetical protein RLZZ628_757 [Bacteroidota bacterium]|jgi:hypothetical protein